MNKQIELYANIVLILIGLAGGIYFYLDHRPNLSLILFSIALASILYQFLGGIGEDNSMRLGALKFGGAGAILIGFMFFIKNFIFTPDATVAGLNVLPETGWVPISLETGKIPIIRISNGADTLIYPEPTDNSYRANRKKHEYQLSESRDGRYTVELRNNPTDTIGYVDINNFNTSRLFNRIKRAENARRFQVFELDPDDPSKNESSELPSVKLPFNIKVFPTARFSIEPYLSNEQVVIRTSYIIPGNNNNFYVVFLEQADFQKRKKFSKWLVEEFNFVLEK